jgi:hypothetical protein
MITKRDMCVAAVTALITTGVVGGAVFAQDPGPGRTILGPATFDWQRMKVVPTPTGEIRQLYKGPTATLPELEMHVTTLLSARIRLISTSMRSWSSSARGLLRRYRMVNGCAWDRGR